MYTNKWGNLCEIWLVFKYAVDFLDDATLRNVLQTASGEKRVTSYSIITLCDVIDTVTLN